MDKQLINRIVEAGRNCKNLDLIEELKIGEGNWENELLMFIKPEVLSLKDSRDMEKVMELIFEKLDEFDAKVEGMYAINGTFLEKNNIMSKHYGYINIISTAAAKSLDADLRKEMEKALGLSPGTYQVLGGHEFLDEFMEYNPSTLDEFWLEQKSTKIRSGLYVRHVKKEGRDIVLANGFHPKQLAYFTDKTHNIVIMLVHSDTAWSKLKNEMVGDTFPEKAIPESIRGVLYKNAKEYGFEAVAITSNCVHLSAGPFEGMAEIINFCGSITRLDLKKQPPLLLRKMIGNNIDYERAIVSLNNPKMDYNGKKTDLFTATENLDSSDAIKVFTNATQ